MKYEFKQSVRIVPRAPKGNKPVALIFAAKSVHTITDHEVLKHPHFLKFKNAGAIVEYKEKVVAKLKPPSELGQKPPRPGVLPGDGGVLKQKQEAAGGKSAADKAKASAATDVAPETEVGGDAEEDAPAKPSKGKSK